MERRIERQEGKILVIGAAYAIPIQEIIIRLFGLKMTHTCIQDYFRPSSLTVSPVLNSPRQVVFKER